ncbi:protein-L-isoaspartate O-methyltransferase [Patescibacteria group bacterium]|nr:protein-L-isoaspartate O-methyltransferase [Patescibacteria group bacterium]
MNKENLLESLKSFGFSKNILNAFSSVRREDFLPPELESRAYEDTSLPIGEGQTISQPYTIGIMLSELDLKLGQKVLEIGSGSGYVLALISKIVGERGNVFGIEVFKSLAEKSKESLNDYSNIKIYNKNGSKGLPEEAPFDRVLISAATRQIPKEVLNQLKEKGILVAPHGPRFEQDIVVLKKEGKEFVTKSKIPGFIFVPFLESEECY